MAGDRRRKLLRLQLRVAWGLSLATLTVTVAFFAALSAGVPFLLRTVGHFIPVASLVAVGILASFVLSILVFSRLSDRVDAASMDEPWT
jgi:hypothetical protein